MCTPGAAQTPSNWHPTHDKKREGNTQFSLENSRFVVIMGMLRLGVFDGCTNVQPVPRRNRPELSKCGTLGLEA